MSRGGYPYLTDAERAARKEAYRQVAAARRRGDLQPQPCESCGRLPTGAHHAHGYDAPLDVEWLCPDCHSARHVIEQRRRFAESYSAELHRRWASAPKEAA